MKTILGRFVDGLPLVHVFASNDVPFFEGAEYESSPAAVREVAVKALIDTGATTSALDHGLCSRLSLRQQGLKRVLFANMSHAEFRPSFTVALAFAADARGSVDRHEWVDFAEMLACDLTGRAFEAVIGMDILGKGVLTVDRASSVAFVF